MRVLTRIKRTESIFKINVALYPTSSNVYDSLAEAFMKSGDTVKAIITPPFHSACFFVRFYWKDYSDYYTEEERQAALSFVSLIASNDTLGEIKRYGSY